MANPNHTPRKSYRLPAATVAALDAIVANGAATSQTGAVAAAVAHYATFLGVSAPGKKNRKKSPATPCPVS